MLAERYAKARRGQRIPVQIAPGKEITLTPGEHSKLIQAIIEEFGPCFVPGGELIYAGDTSEKWGYFDEAKLKSLGVTVDAHGKMPDAVLYCPKRKWLLLIEAVTSHGPVDGKRHEELAKLFSASKAGLIYVTAFPNRTPMGRNLDRPDDRSCIATRSRVIVALPLVSGRTPIDPAAADAAFRRS